MVIHQILRIENGGVSVTYRIGGAVKDEGKEPPGNPRAAVVGKNINEPLVLSGSAKAEPEPAPATKGKKAAADSDKEKSDKDKEAKGTKVVKDSKSGVTVVIGPTIVLSGADLSGLGPGGGGEGDEGRDPPP